MSSGKAEGGGTEVFMLRGALRDELDGLNGSVGDLLGSVKGSLSEMVSFLENPGSVNRGHGRIERFKMRGEEIEDECLLFQARQAPVACDLRLVRAVSSAARHAVRAGVLCEHVFRAFEFSNGEPSRRELDDTMERMAREAREVFRRGVEAFQKRDVRNARGLEKADETVDRLCAEVMRLAVDGDGLSASPGEISRAALVAHYLERIADHGVDIGMLAVFAVEGKIE